MSDVRVARTTKYTPEGTYPWYEVRACLAEGYDYESVVLTAAEARAYAIDLLRAAETADRHNLGGSQ